MNDLISGLLPSEEELIKIIMNTSATVWNHKLNEKNIEKWLNNFVGEFFYQETERRIALWLLCHFVYYNEEEVKHLCVTLLNEFIHQILLGKGLANPSNFEIEDMLKTTAFISLGRPSESGAFILYYFRQVNNLHISYFIPPDKSKLPSVERVVYIDDVTLTAGPGGQAYSYFKSSTEDSAEKILLTFISTKNAKEYLEQNNIRVISTIMLEDRDKCFDDRSFIFQNLHGITTGCKQFASFYGRKLLPSHPLGYSNGQFLFGFFYNTPDNTLPIFWSNKNNWYPIVSRYDKNYSQKGIQINERFV